TTGRGSKRQFRMNQRGLPIRQGTERRLAQAGSAAPALRPAAKKQESVTDRAGMLSGVVVAVLAASAAPDLGRAQAPFTREQVLAALARATPQHPADFTGMDLSGLDLAGI